MNILTFDIEDWWVYEKAGLGDRAEWRKRLDWYLDSILELLDKRGFKATFFVLGKMVECAPDVVLKIEVQGGAQVKKLAPDCVTIFVLPPSLEELERRLRTRGTDSEEKIHERLQTAVKEMQCAGEYDYIVYNDTVEQAVRDILTVIAAEKLRFSRDPQVIERMLSHAETFCQ